MNVRAPWFQIVIFSLFVLFAVSVFTAWGSSVPHAVWEPRVWQSWALISLMGTGVFLVGSSLLLGTLAKFFKRFQTYLHFRKQLGVVGFLYLVLATIFMIPLIMANPEWIDTHLSVGITWFVALIFLWFCTYISRPKMIKKLGAQRWRRLLRYFSYGGFGLALISLYSVYCVSCLQIQNVPGGAFPALFWIGFGLLVFAVRSVTVVYDVLHKEE